MTSKLSILACLLAVQTICSVGCTSSGGPFLGAAGVPIPVSPYFQQREEDKHWVHERYGRVPILGPIGAGGEPEALDPPSDDEVMRALERVRGVGGGIPFLWERQRNNVRITKELIQDSIDPVRVMPLVGPVQQHHCHYKCTVYFSEKTRVGWPLPHTKADEDVVEVIYIDHNHLHMVGDVDPGGPATRY